MTNTSSRFCTGCGTALVATAAICPSCGTPAQSQAINYVTGKSKTTAVLLAVFLGFWSWLYTFKVDKAKFFIGLGLQVLNYFFLIQWFSEFMVSSTAYTDCVSNSYYSDYSYGSSCTPISVFTTNYLIATALGFGSWLWAVIDQSRRPKEYFENFPR